MAPRHLPLYSKSNDQSTPHIPLFHFRDKKQNQAPTKQMDHTASQFTAFPVPASKISSQTDARGHYHNKR